MSQTPTYLTPHLHTNVSTIGQIMLLPLAKYITTLHLKCQTYFNIHTGTYIDD